MMKNKCAYLGLSNAFVPLLRIIASLSERLWRVFAGEATAAAAARATARPGLFTPMFARGDCAAVTLERRLLCAGREDETWVSIWIFGGGENAWQEEEGVLGVAESVIAELGPAASSSRGKVVWIFERPSEKSVE